MGKVPKISNGRDNPTQTRYKFANLSIFFEVTREIMFFILMNHKTVLLSATKVI